MSAFTEANRKAFNDLSATYNSQPWQYELSQQVSDALQQRKDWIGAAWIKPNEPEDRRDVRLLDYASGTGSITRALAPYVHTIRGIDLSENMVKAYNEAARSSGLTEQQAYAVVGDLFAPQVSPELNGQEYHDFDIAVIGLGFHHFEDPPLALKRLAERVKPETGVVVIVDFLPFEHNADTYAHGSAGMGDMQHTIKHCGFTSQGMQRLFEAAGCEDFGFEIVPEPAVMEIKGEIKKRTIFIATGRRQPTVLGKLRNWVGGMQDVVGGQMGRKTEGEDARGGVLGLQTPVDASNARNRMTPG